MKANDIVRVLKGSMAFVSHEDYEIDQLLTDSRKTGDLSGCLFFAIPTKRNTGSRYVYDLYGRGVRNFVVPINAEEEYVKQFRKCSEANFWYVKNVVKSLQQVAADHRSQYAIPVVGITGSNGKTIVKDWIVQMLGGECRIVSSPRSYNSQIGVPLSVWQMSDEDEMGVFEAGISEAGEMDNLREVIKPTIGIFTNIGQAHDENFLTRSQKVAEKLQLFTHCQVLIYSTDHKDIHSAISAQEGFRSVTRYTWGHGEDNALQLVDVKQQGHGSTITMKREGQPFVLDIPFGDRASVENAMHCIALLCYLGYDNETIADKCRKLTSVAMRLEMNEAINNCLLVNDSYSLDIDSLAIALDYVLHERSHRRTTLIMSDILQAGMPEQDLYGQVSRLITQHGISRFVAIGDALNRNKALFQQVDTVFYESTEDFLRNHPFEQFNDETILLKGARKFHFEDIAKMLQRKSHQTIMEVSLDNLISNLNYYRSCIKPTTRLMAMVKASSYGAGKSEIASVLQYNHVDYLTVAYSDEGVDLRRNGITLPIMVMNPEEESFGDIIRYGLEPDIYSFRILEAFSQAVKLMGSEGQKVPIHVELDTGMHRLGFSQEELTELGERLLSEDSVLKVKSIFSHLACSEDPEMDDFSRMQIDRFTQWSQSLRKQLGDPKILCHILNSSGIIRFPEAQMDMVRLGIGLYGIAPQPEVQRCLKPVSRLTTKISQIKNIPQGDTVGYNRLWVAERPSRIAIISIGYADGLNRHLGYGNGKVMVNGKEAPIIGSICMDMCFIDVTDVSCSEGDDVVIFGDADLLQEISKSAGTIPYEILTSVSPRVKRVYFQE